jgi:hypothetical protein
MLKSKTGDLLIHCKKVPVTGFVLERNEQQNAVVGLKINTLTYISFEGLTISQGGKREFRARE